MPGLLSGNAAAKKVGNTFSGTYKIFKIAVLKLWNIFQPHYQARNLFQMRLALPFITHKII